MKASLAGILLVDDDPDSAELLQMCLQGRGFDVVVATSLAAAREAIRARHFDILVSDLLLPDGDACELLSDLRAKQPIKAVALTGWSRVEDLERSKRAGFAEHLVKPVSMATIESVLHRLMAA